MEVRCSKWGLGWESLDLAGTWGAEWGSLVDSLVGNSVNWGMR